ncbi:hypothetical protein OM076_13240 [Solirubrobacter ginsenosidimutans]|uniref:Cadherin repeat domain-containing protein n=1 Tax=Solirubrobacter ginsenosidimutans TaxID=490573 RepID=A0A9X3S1L2_9ACTN|nr:hypothetical protein [Solirubrobacter ginsenosidimutans]MDA0161237.1 hypothetical protein [Solirubrobacter ginsenosidimutans]
MRLALILIALFTLSASAARADVFVPADPPVLRSAQCVAGGGDVIAAGTEPDKPLRLSVGGGGWRELPGLRGCPVIAAAGDGTLALVGLSVNRADTSLDGASLVVREPGGAFGAPIVLGGDSTSGAAAVAVAPGGWVAVAWIERDVGLTVLVRRPDGSEVRTLLEPFPGVLDISDAHVGINASGDVTVAWTRFDRRTMRLRVARGVAGAAPVAGPDLASPAESFGELALAIAPAGGSLVAWTDADGAHAILDGQPPAVVAPAAPGAQLAAGLADDGTALLVYMAGGSEIVAAERVAGEWLQPRVLSPARAGVDRNQDHGSSEELQLDVQVALGAGGRAAVAWTAIPRQIVGAVGAVGGRWSAATRLSSATRIAYALNLAVDAGGVPRALWSEAGLGARGAAPAAAPLDASPPAVTARLPSRVRPTADGNIVVTARVRCSEACDARLAFAGGENDRGNISQALEPGATETLRLRASDELQYELIAGRAARRLRLTLLVTDRAGNLVRRSVALRVRVLEPPIRTLKVPLGRKFGMETPAGNRAVARLVNDMIETIARGHVSSAALSKRYSRSIRTIARKFGPDYTYSDEVGTAIYDALWIPLARTHHDVGYVLQGE